MTYLEPRLRVVPVGPDDSGVLRGQVGDLDLVLLSPLVGHVVPVRPREVDLRGVVDVAANVELAFLEKNEENMYLQNAANFFLPLTALFSFLTASYIDTDNDSPTEFVP